MSCSTDTTGLRLVSLIPTSTIPQPYDEPIGFTFKVECDFQMTKPFKIVFCYMNLDDAKHDIELEEYDIDPLPAGISEFDLDVQLMDHNKIKMEDLVGTHGLEIKFLDAETKQMLARRGSEIIISYKDEQEMEENMPDVILGEHLIVTNLGVRGAPKHVHAHKTAITAVAPEKESGNIRQRVDHGQENVVGPAVPQAPKQE